jgi:ubiquinone biosynthesis monooxygenase Coq7
MNAKEEIIEKIVRVDQAGEVGAQRIYEGQKLVFKFLKNKSDLNQVSKMAKEEKEHLEYFDNIAQERGIKRTKLAPLFDAGAFMMGVGSALLGQKAAYVCTEAVEEVIEEHYQNQIDQLEGVDNEIREKLKKFKEDEINHKKTAINMGSQKFFGYTFLRSVINKTTKAAIFFAERI